MLTHANLMHNSALIAYAFEHTRSGSGVFWLPSYHDMGLIGGILQPLYIGQTSMLLSPMSFLQQAVSLVASDLAVSLHDQRRAELRLRPVRRKVTPEQRATLDLSSWRLAFNGAEPVRAETIDRFTKTSSPADFAARRSIPATAWPKRR